MRPKLVLFFLFLVNLAFSQEADILWEKTVSVSERNDIGSMQVTLDSGFVAVGSFSESVGAISGAFLVKLSPEGNILWQKTYGAVGDSLRNIQIANDGGYLLTGDCASKGAGIRDVWIIKTDIAGNVKWEKVYGGAKFEKGHSALVLEGGGFAINAFTASFLSDTSTSIHSDGTTIIWDQGNAWFLRLDEKGDTLFTKILYKQTKGFDEAYTMVASSSGGFVFGGMSYYGGDFLPWTFEVDSMGSNQRQYNTSFNYAGGRSHARTTALCPTKDGGYLVAGLDGYFANEVFIGKLQRNGMASWGHVLHGAKPGIPANLLPLSNGRVAILTRDALIIADSLGGFTMISLKGRFANSMVWNGADKLILAGKNKSQGWVAQIGFNGKTDPNEYLSSEVLNPLEVDLNPHLQASDRSWIHWSKPWLTDYQSQPKWFLIQNAVTGDIQARLERKAFGAPVYTDDVGPIFRDTCLDSSGAGQSRCIKNGYSLVPEGGAPGTKDAPFFMLPIEAPSPTSSQLKSFHLQNGNGPKTVYQMTRNSCITTNPSGMACVVNIDDSLHGNFDPVVISLDRFGKVKWARRFLTPASELGLSISQSVDGGLLIAGSSNSYARHSRVLVIKMNSTGQTKWARTFSYADLANAQGYRIPENVDTNYVDIDNKMFWIDFRALHLQEIGIGEYLLLTEGGFGVSIVRLDLPEVSGIKKMVKPNQLENISIQLRGQALFLKLKMAEQLEVEIRDLLAIRSVRLYAGLAKPGEMKLNLNGWANGAYLVSVSSVRGRWNSRFVLMH